MYRIVKLDLASNPPRRIVTEFVARDFATLLTEGHKYLEEKENYFITHYECDREIKLIKGDRIFFDIDGIDMTSLHAYVDIFVDVLGIQKENLTVINSGNGLHILLQLIESFDDEEYFSKNRVYYKYICDKVQAQIEKSGLSGSIDALVFSPRKFVRLPESSNFKPKKSNEHKSVKLISLGTTPYPQSLQALSGYTHPETSDFVNPVMLEHLTIDTGGVLAGCEFLKWVKAHQASVSEPQWYASLSILARLKDGEKLCHEYSKDHPSYSESETDRKIAQAINTAGPRKCDNINSVWGKCNGCPHQGKISSPILIKGDEFLSTENTGFRNMKVTKSGEVKKGAVNYQEFGKYFSRKFNHITLPSGDIYIKESTNYEEFNSALLGQYIQDKVDDPRDKDVKECLGVLRRTSVVLPDKLNPNSYLNLQNGVLELDTMELRSRTELPDIYFTYTSDYDFNPEADCPLFLEKVSEIFEGTPEGSIELFRQFVGASIYGVPNKKMQKGMILYGMGGNGKSLLFGVIRSLLTDGMCSAIPMSGYQDKSCIRLVGKRVNICDETPQIKHFEAIKKAISGERMEGRSLYKDSVEFECNTKTLVATNSIPNFLEQNDAMKRRFIILLLPNSFVGREDLFIYDKLANEKSGILNWFIEGAKDFIARNYNLSIPSEVQGVLDDTLDEAVNYDDPKSVCYLYGKECLEYSGAFFTSNEDIRIHFKDWCARNGVDRYVTDKCVAPLSKYLASYAREYLNFLKPTSKSGGIRGHKCTILGTDENMTANF